MTDSPNAVVYIAVGGQTLPYLLDRFPQAVIVTQWKRIAGPSTIVFPYVQILLLCTFVLSRVSGQMVQGCPSTSTKQDARHAT